MRVPNPSAEVAQWLQAAASIVALTGAGMSAESGIPTFRGGGNGLWSQFDPSALASADAFRADRALVWGWYLWRAALVRHAEPHDGHHALARIAARVPKFTLVTQNVDDLHERAGNEDVIHLHGSLFSPRCFACHRPCGEVTLPDDAITRPTLRLVPPRCRHCGGYIRPGVVWFGERLPVDAWCVAEKAARECGLLLAIGTSGIVHPAATLPLIAKAHAAKVVEINPVATELSGCADVTWRSTAAQALPALAEAVAS